MTAAPAGPSGSSGFSLFTSQGYGLYRSKREIFLFSMIGQALVVGLLAYFISNGLLGSPANGGIRPLIKDLPLVFSGSGGGGGGSHDKTTASVGVLPRASMSEQLAVPTVVVPKEMPRLAVEPTMVAPEVTLQAGQVGDPASQISGILSGGRGKLGVGDSCCGGVGDYKGHGYGPGPDQVGIGGRGVANPRVIYNPEPVRRWRFQPATVNGQPVARQIAVEVNFHLY